MKTYVLPFEKIRKEDIASAGGKGANLGEMTAAGIPIPKGGVLLSEAYREYMKANAIDAGSFADAKDLREAILQGKLPEEIEKALKDFYASLGSGTARVAVRSSATAEDLEDASFAGQQETYLNVTGLQDLTEKVKMCYASLWGDRACSYRKRAGYDTQDVALAVVIQEMIESEAAGVMFTADPAGDPENIHINASYGLGEAVVSGIVSPDEYLCDRNGSVLRERIGSKEEEIRYREGVGGTEKVAVSEERRKQKVLDNDLVKALVREGLRIEEHYGQPMDIEWAVKDNVIYILQARSITTLAKEKKVYTQEDFAGYPKVKPARGATREAVLFNMEKNPMPYYPLDHDFGGYVGEQKNILFTEIGITFPGGMNPIDRDGVSYPASGKMKLNKNILAVPKMLRRVNNIENNMTCAQQSLKECRTEYERESEKEYKDAKEIGKALRRMHDLIGRTAYDRFLYALFPNALESKKVTAVLKKVDPQRNAYDILEGLGYVTADMNREMKQLCEWIASDAAMTECVMQKDYRTISERYPELGKKFTEFLKKYGSKSDFNCYCFAAETWRENPDRFVNTLRPMLKDGGRSVATKEEGETRYRELMQRVQQKLPEKKFADFKRRVKGLRFYHYIREASQYLWESEFAYCRKLLRDLSAVCGIAYGDLLYLFAEELYDACENGFGKAKELIAARKEKRPFAEAYWDKCMKDTLAGEDDTIRGVGASNGQAKGRVCIVRSPEEFYKLEKGDILVCTYTDPEWTPLFALAGGVVVDTGGTLSHAAIVAREYGIPAVLATGDATQKLKDGDMVIVNAGEGSVTVLD